LPKYCIVRKKVKSKNLTTMKTVKFLLAAILAIVVFTNSNAQTGAKTSTVKTEAFKVSGNCGMCKERIETAAKVDGVSKAEWNKDTKMLTLAYDPSKVKSDDVQKKVAAVGHDTEKYKADTKVYNGLPGCCKYR
jgi:mercuric ion binding protein